MRAAVIPTTGRGCLSGCIAAIAPQVDALYLVANNADLTSAIWQDLPASAVVMDEGSGKPNLSHLWNVGLRRARADGAHFVSVLNDDVVVSPDWFIAVQSAMERSGSALGGTPRFGRENLVAGYAFMLADSLEADERFEWWYGDDDLIKQAGRRHVIVPEAKVEHLYPNGHTVGDPELSAQAQKDRAQFVRKWRNVL